MGTSTSTTLMADEHSVAAGDVRKKDSSPPSSCPSRSTFTMKHACLAPYTTLLLLDFCDHTMYTSWMMFCTFFTYFIWLNFYLGIICTMWRLFCFIFFPWLMRSFGWQQTFTCWSLYCDNLSPTLLDANAGIHHLICKSPGWRVRSGRSFHARLTHRRWRVCPRFEVRVPIPLLRSWMQFTDCHVWNSLPTMHIYHLFSQERLHFYSYL